MALYSGYIAGWSLLNPSKTPPRDPPMPFREAAPDERALLRALPAADPRRVHHAGRRPASAHGMRGMGRQRRTDPRLVERGADPRDLHAEPDGRDAPDLHIIMLILVGASWLLSTTKAMAYTGIPNALASGCRVSTSRATSSSSP